MGTMASKFLREWTKEDCADWITTLGEEFILYGETFEFNKVDGITLQRLKKSELTKLGIKNHAQQKAIMSRLQKIINRDQARKLREAEEEAALAAARAAAEEAEMDS